MSRDQAILAQLDASAARGGRPEKAQAALQGVPRLAEELSSLERELTRATDDAEETLRAAAQANGTAPASSPPHAPQASRVMVGRTRLPPDPTR